MMAIKYEGTIYNGITAIPGASDMDIAWLQDHATRPKQISDSRIRSASKVSDMAAKATCSLHDLPKFSLSPDPI